MTTIETEILAAVDSYPDRAQVVGVELGFDLYRDYFLELSKAPGTTRTYAEHGPIDGQEKPGNKLTVTADYESSRKITLLLSDGRRHPVTEPPERSS